MIQSTRAFARLVDAFNQNDWPRVQQRAAQLLLIAPLDTDVRYMAGIACMQSGQMAAALEHLRQAATADPPRADYLAQHAKALALLRRMREALPVAERALSLPSPDAFTLDTLGTVFMQCQAQTQATEAFRRALAMQPGTAPIHLNYAYALNATGDAAGAERELEACIKLEPRYWYAHVLLAQLQRQSAEHNHVDRLQQLLARRATDLGARLLLNIALGKECDDLGDYPQAFDHYTRGKAAGRRPGYDFARDAAMFDAVMRAFPEPETGAPVGDPTREPIFIIGMPRTGTTLLDRVLSSHPDVRSLGELQNFATALQRASGCPTALLGEADLAARTQHVDWAKLGADYLASTRPGSGQTPCFIDKMPHHFLYAGFIARALPNAKIVCLRRDPLDTCVGNFRHLFENESAYYDYSFDLADTGRYFIAFDRLMAHWRRVLPGRILELPYESLVDDAETATRRLLDFCELPWNDACLHPERNDAPVNTPNAWQVRAPIYRHAIGQWRHYETQLQGLRKQLAAADIAVAD